MDNTRFLTAIEEVSASLETETGHDFDGGATMIMEKTPTKSDLIDFGTKPENVKVRKPNAIDQFFANQANADILSPIKAKPTLEPTVDPTQESLDLKLEGSDFQNRPQYQPKCVQPDDSSFTYKGKELRRTIGGEADAEVEERREFNVHDNLPPRKRLQDEMAPAVFDVPRATKMPHREDSPPIPEFRENAKPLLRFTSETEDPFNPATVAGEVGDNDNNKKDAPETKLETAPKAADELQDGGEDVEPIIPTAEGFRKTLNQRFNKTLDMTLRTSGGTAFASGLFLAIDEALDPLVGALVPYGRRRRGANIVVVCVPVLLALYFLFFW